MGVAGAVAATRGVAGAGLGALRAGTAMGSAASTAYKLGQETSGTSTIGAGIGGMASAAKGAAANRMHNALGLRAAAARGQQTAWAAGTSGASSANASAASGDASPPAWAQKLQDRKSTRLNPSHYCASRMPSSA